jgi:hypothetical protein
VFNRAAERVRLTRLSALERSGGACFRRRGSDAEQRRGGGRAGHQIPIQVVANNTVTVSFRRKS